MSYLIIPITNIPAPPLKFTELRPWEEGCLDQDANQLYNRILPSLTPLLPQSLSSSFGPSHVTIIPAASTAALDLFTLL